MNLKKELQKMSISDLKYICKQFGLSCSSKRSAIKLLLLPLSKQYSQK